MKKGTDPVPEMLSFIFHFYILLLTLKLHFVSEVHAADNLKLMWLFL